MKFTGRDYVLLGIGLVGGTKRSLPIPVNMHLPATGVQLIIPAATILKNGLKKMEEIDPFGSISSINILSNRSKKLV